MFHAFRLFSSRVLLVAGLLAVTPLCGVAATSAFTVINAPAAGTGTLQGTSAIGIDTAGDAAGNYIDAKGTSHGFFYSAAGQLTPIDAPNASTGKDSGTFVSSINYAGEIAGYYTSSTGKHGFVRTAAGIITTFDAESSGVLDVRSINQAGDVTGTAPNTSGSSEGFLRTAAGTVTPFSVSDGKDALYPTYGIAINVLDVIAGRYVTTDGISHGFVRAASGTITTFDPPNLATKQIASGKSGTLPTSMDDAGNVVGTYTDTNGARHSFLYTANGTITTFDAPGAQTTPCAASGIGALLCGTGTLGIVDTSGSIVDSSSKTKTTSTTINTIGSYVDAEGVAHGYVQSTTTSATGPNCTDSCPLLVIGGDSTSNSYTSFDVPGAGTGAFQGTAAFSANIIGVVMEIIERNGETITETGTILQTIVGTYIDKDSVLHGFLYNPAWAATTTTVAASSTTSIYGEPVTLTATVAYGATAGEKVWFSNGQTQLGSATLNSKGIATFTTTALPVGANSITATYVGDATYSGNTSSPVTVTVGKASSTSTLSLLTYTSALSLSATQGQTLTIHVTGQYGGTPSGTISGTIQNSLNNVITAWGPVTLVNGSATISHPATGTYTIVATYSGDANFASSKASGTYTFTTNINPILSPASGSTLTGSTVKFTWGSGGGATAYKLILGTTAGGSDLYDSYTITATTVTVKNLPINGATIYATLYSEIGGVWQSYACTYTAASPAVLITPAPGSTFTGSMVKFTWSSGGGATAYKLILGTTKGGDDLYNSYTTAATTKTVTNLPTNGETIYATLYSEIGGIWYSNASTYTAK